MMISRWSIVRVALLVAAAALALPAAARADKPDKVPVALGSWTGKGSGTFKGALRRGLSASKECAFVPAKRARAIIEGQVAEAGKGVVVKVIVKAAATGEVVEQKEFPFARPTANNGQANRMGKQVADMARRAPDGSATTTAP